MDPWLAQLLDGLAEYDATHPELFSNHAWGYQQADCPCHLLRDVPDKVVAEARAYMAGWKAREAAEQDRDKETT